MPYDMIAAQAPRALAMTAGLVADLAALGALPIARFVDEAAP
jgi:hypothetical protein